MFGSDKMANSKKELNKKLNKVVNVNDKKKSSINKSKNNINKKSNNKPRKNVKSVNKTKKVTKTVEKAQKQEQELVIASKKPQKTVNKKAKKEKPIELKPIITKENPQKPVDKKTKKSKISMKSILSKIYSPIKKYKKIILITLIVLAVCTGIMIFINRTPKELFLTFKSYEMGEEVILKDDSKWYVVSDSGINKSDVELLSSEILDINGDKKIDGKDKVQFDSDNNCIYDAKNEKNIANYLNKNSKELLKNIDGIKKIRLLTSKEYIDIRDKMEFGYDWVKGNWLANEKVSSWWLETTKYNRIYIVTKTGSYKLAEPKEKNYIRPVIKIDKGLIK